MVGTPNISLWLLQLGVQGRGATLFRNAWAFVLKGAWGGRPARYLGAFVNILGSGVTTHSSREISTMLAYAHRRLPLRNRSDQRLWGGHRRIALRSGAVAGTGCACSSTEDTGISHSHVRSVPEGESAQAVLQQSCFSEDLRLIGSAAVHFSDRWL